MSDDEMLVSVEKRKGQGNELFKAKKYQEAETKYNEALGFIYTCQSFNQEQHDLQIKVLTNLSLCTNNLGKWP